MNKGDSLKTQKKTDKTKKAKKETKKVSAKDLKSLKGGGCWWEECGRVKIGNSCQR